MTRSARSLVIGAVTALTSLATVGSASAAAGDLDARFSGDGATHVTGDGATDVGLQSTGKVIVVGTRLVGPDASEAVVTRLKANGSVDPTFGVGGTVAYQVNGAAVQPTSLVIQPDDAIIVVGSSGDGDAFQMTATRITAAGAVDATFGVGGHRVLSRGTNSQLTDVALDATNRIVASGWSSTSAAATPLVVRLLQDGSRDTAFDGDGLQPLVHPASAVAYAHDIDLTSNGRYVVAVEVVKTGGVIETSVMQVRANSNVDTTFGKKGYRRVAFPGTTRTRPLGLEIDPTGRVVVLVNAGDEPGNIGAAVAVLTPQGALDATFDTDGRVVIPLIGGISVQDGTDGDLAVQDDGRILVGASIWAEGGFEDSSILRLRTDGRLDRSFSGDGAVVFDPLWEGASRLTAIALSPTNGRVYAAGYVVDYMEFEGTTPGVVAIRTR